MPGIRHLTMRLDGLMLGNQTWSVNPKFTYPPTAVPTQASMDAWVAAVEAAGSQLGLPVQTIVSDRVAVLGVTASYIDDTGHATVIAKQVFATPLFGTGTAKMPPQSALVATLQTHIPGRRARGRLYWPCMAITLDDTTLRVPPTVAQDVADSTATWLHDLAAAFGTATPILPTVSSSVGGTNSIITSVRVGDVVDTQRRRRDQLTESYVVAPVT